MVLQTADWRSHTKSTVCNVPRASSGKYTVLSTMVIMIQILSLAGRQYTVKKGRSKNKFKHIYGLSNIDYNKFVKLTNKHKINN